MPYDATLHAIGRSLGRHLASLLCTMIVIGGAARQGMACDTPVFRYAMYVWSEPAPYHVYAFHRGPASAEFDDANRAITSLIEAAPARANLELTLVDLLDEAAVVALPAHVQAAWEKTARDELPLHLVFNPRGSLVDAGRLAESDVLGLVDSPARTELAEQLAAGRAGVLVVLTGADAEANQAVLSMTEEVVKLGETGQIEPITLGPSISDVLDANPILDVGVVVVDRDDPAEQWLVQALLALEPDLRDDPRPMVFPAYGRGRAMEPFLGGGVTVDNLGEAIAFLAGACSCQIKEQSPGMDLPMRWDWEAAALEVADRYGAEEGNERLFGEEDLPPGVLFPTSEADETDAEFTSRGAVEEVTEADVAAERVEPVGLATRPIAAHESFRGWMGRVLGLGAAVVCLIVLGAGFAYTRTRG